MFPKTRDPRSFLAWPACRSGIRRAQGETIVRTTVQLILRRFQGKQTVHSDLAGERSLYVVNDDHDGMLHRIGEGHECLRQRDVFSDPNALDREVAPSHLAVRDAEALGDSRDGRVVLADRATNPSGDRLARGDVGDDGFASLHCRKQVFSDKRRRARAPGECQKILDGEAEVGEFSRIRAVSYLAALGR